MTTKSERTRELLVDTALRLFRERGYEATTMRLVATQAGVSAGNAYYHFEGKDALVQVLYERLQVEHRDRAEPLLVQGAPLADNLRAVLHAGLDVFTPWHAFGDTLVHVALRRSSATSPFSAESGPAREAAIALLTQTLAASRGVPRGPLRDRLPHLLWLGWLGITLHWVTDTSPDQRRTRQLIDGVVLILTRVLALSRLPVGRGLSADVVGLVDRLTASPTHPEV